MPDWVLNILKEIASEFPTLVVCLLVVFLAFKRVTQEHDKHMKSKNEEIERLVAEKNQLQELVLENRLSTRGDRDKDNDRKKSKGKKE